MTISEKLAQLKTLLEIEGSEQDDRLSVYLNLAKSEILSWLYSGWIPDDVEDVPVQYEPTQVMAVIAGYGQAGAEGQLSHGENSISRTWKYEDMAAYIRSRVIAYVGVM